MLFLSILKIIGIVLLSIVGVLLLLIFLVLFVPFRYRICGSFHEEIPEGGASVGWLCSFLKVGVIWKKGEPISAKVYLAGFTIRDLMKKKQEEESEPSTKLGVAEPQQSVAQEEIPKAAKAPEEIPKAAKAQRKSQKPQQEKLPPAERIRRKVEELKQKVLTLYQQIHAAVTDKTDRLSKLNALWNEERYAKERALLLRQIRRVLCHILPTRGAGRLLFGTGDPYSTGQVMQIAAMTYPLWAKHFEVIPEFSEAVIDADLNIRGRIRLVLIAWAAGRIFFNRNLRKMYRKARKILQ